MHGVINAFDAFFWATGRPALMEMGEFSPCACTRACTSNICTCMQEWDGSEDHVMLLVFLLLGRYALGALRALRAL